METYLKNINVWCWKYLENTRNYPGLHLTAKADACDALLKCLWILEQEGHGAKRTIPLKSLDPKDEAKISGGQRFHCFSILKIFFYRETADLRQMCISEIDDIVLIESTEVRIQQLRQGIQDVRKGCGDYSIAPKKKRKENLLLGDKDKKSLELWFWPCFGHLYPE